MTQPNRPRGRRPRRLPADTLVEAELVLYTDQKAPEPRGQLELINKTNQFNLNGRPLHRWGMAGAHLCQPGAFLFTSSPTRTSSARFGKIAVVAGRRDGAVLLVDTWVMSCRAFSRRIEHQCVRLLFDRFAVDEIAFDYRPTDRNGPCHEFFAALLGGPPSDLARLPRDLFASRCPPLFHDVKVSAHG